MHSMQKCSEIMSRFPHLPQRALAHASEHEIDDERQRCGQRHIRQRGGNSRQEDERAAAARVRPAPIDRVQHKGQERAAAVDKTEHPA